MSEEETLCFYDQNFLSMHPLSSSNVMEYFSTSQFYDRRSLNEILKMQSQFANIDISHRLTTTPGFYYCLEHEAENLYLIAKKEFDGKRTVILRMYYCMFGYIYCAPTIRSVSEARIADCLSHLNDALDKYEEKKKFDWVKGFVFREAIKDGNEDRQEVKFMFEVLHEFDIQKGPRDDVRSL